MDYLKYTAEMLEQLLCPAFLVKDGRITHANTSAVQRQIEIGSTIKELICVGAEEYDTFKEGKLCLTLCICGCEYLSDVTNIYEHHLFCLETEYADAAFRAFSLAATCLRAPLTNIFNAAEQLTAQTPVDSASKEYINYLNYGILQLLRTVNNMSDAPQYKEGNNFVLSPCDAVYVFNNIMEKAADIVKKAGKKLTYSAAKLSAVAPIDRAALERAALNLISNAIKYSKKDSDIRVELFHHNYRLYFTVENELNENDQINLGNFFTRFLREPGIKDGNSGIGLGMTIVRSIASKHGGTVLLEQPEPNRIRITMAISTYNSNSANILKSGVQYPADHSDSSDLTALELSDALPASVYKTIG